MSVEFRQRTAGEFFRMLKRRKWLIILPIITMTAAVGYVVYKLPSVFESKTLLTINPPQISEIVVKSLTNDDISARLQTINQEVLSRNSLEPMVMKYDLFKLERNAGTPMELIIEKMQKNIHVEVEKTEDERKVASFSIKYLDRTPEAARNVAGEIASKYVNAQVVASTQTAEVTKEFLENQKAQKKAELDQIEQERLGIMMQNVDTLPESSQGLIAQLQGLRSREDTISKEKETLITEKGRLQDSIRTLNSQARLIEDYGEKETEDATRKAASVEDTPAYGQLIQKRAELTAKLEKLKAVYREKHPEVIDTQTQIAKVNEELTNLSANTEKRVKEANRSSSRKAEMQKQNLLIERQKAESQITQIEQQLQYKDQELQQNAGQISILESKINTIPNVKVALESINTRYQSAKTAYDDLLKKTNDASLQVSRESNAQGETIRVVDAANLPQSPVAPKRAVLTAVGGGIGLFLGLFLAGLFELPRIFKIQNIEDAKHYTGLPVLASVPPLLSHDEKMWLKRSHWLKVFVGSAVAVGLIPLIALILQATRIFERMIS
ncbi:MAG TPA: GNVR domain-containing protein [Pyrinomonadaceae bacterium]|nr:GNVR domain-containing protein [Pyrinomonadaceae bacterium]